METPVLSAQQSPIRNPHSIHRPSIGLTDEMIEPVECGTPSNGVSVVGAARGEIGLPPDECWLYKHPKRAAIQPSGTAIEIEPISSWLREVFDSPKSQFSRYKRNLLTRLEVILASGGPISAYRFGGSVPSLNAASAARSPFVCSMRGRTSACPITSMDLTTKNQRDPGLPIRGSIDNLTTIAAQSFDNNIASGMTSGTSALQMYGVHPPQYSLPPQRSGSQRLSNAPSNSTSHLSQSLGGQSNRPWSGSTGKVGSCDGLEQTSKANVQEIARIQEDNLKADVAALVAAAAGRHGSQHSLGSLGHRTPDGSLSRLTSAPESPSASNTHLAQIVPTGFAPEVPDTGDTVSIGLCMDSDSVHMSVDSVLSSDMHRATGYITETPVDKTDANRSGPVAFGFGRSPSAKLAFAVLPQKPTVPGYIAPDLTAADALQFCNLPSNQNGNHSVIGASGPPVDTRSHFGFRPMRKISSPHHASKPPPLPSSASQRRVSTSNLHQIDP